MRVVSLVPSLTETLFDLGAGDAALFLRERSLDEVTEEAVQHTCGRSVCW